MWIIQGLASFLFFAALNNNDILHSTTKEVLPISCKILITASAIL